MWYLQTTSVFIATSIFVAEFYFEKGIILFPLGINNYFIYYIEINFYNVSWILITATHLQNYTRIVSQQVVK